MVSYLGTTNRPLSA